MQTTALKNRVLQGGIYLAIRQLLGVGLSLVSVLVVARQLGPAQYGIFASVAAVFYFCLETTRLGLDVFLIRDREAGADAPVQVLAFFTTAGALVAALLWWLLGALGSTFEVVQALRWLVPVLWLAVMGCVPMAMIERELRFDQVSRIEAVAQTLNCLATVALVFAGSGFWGPVAGLALQFGAVAVLAAVARPLRWQLRWRPAFILAALKASLLYVGANWIWALRSLAVPVLVGRLAGLEAVGIVSIAVRLAEQLGVLRVVAYRLSISALARLAGEPEKMRLAIGRGLLYQGLLVGPLYAGFACVGGVVVPLLFGQGWLGSTQLFAWVALGLLVNSVFNLHTSALYASGRSGEVARFHLAYVGLLWLVGWLAIPPLGVWGYAVAEVAAFAAYLLIHRSVVALCGAPAYGEVAWLLAATVPPLLAGPWLPPAVGLGVLAVGYSTLFFLRPRLRHLPGELLTAWRSRRAPAAA